MNHKEKKKHWVRCVYDWKHPQKSLVCWSEGDWKKRVNKQIKNLYQVLGNHKENIKLALNNSLEYIFFSVKSTVYFLLQSKYPEYPFPDHFSCSLVQFIKLRFGSLPAMFSPFRIESHSHCSQTTQETHLAQIRVEIWLFFYLVCAGLWLLCCHLFKWTTPKRKTQQGWIWTDVKEHTYLRVGWASTGLFLWKWLENESSDETKFNQNFEFSRRKIRAGSFSPAHTCTGHMYRYV